MLYILHVRIICTLCVAICCLSLFLCSDMWYVFFCRWIAYLSPDFSMTSYYVISVLVSKENNSTFSEQINFNTLQEKIYIIHKGRENEDYIFFLFACVYVYVF